MGNIVTKLAFLPPPPSYTSQLPGLVMVRDKVPCVYITAPTSKKMKSEDYFTLLFTHGNASDMGEMLGWLEFLSVQIPCNICAYDYTGYGLNVGNPGEKQCYQDISAVYEYLINDMKISASKIILMGQSLGSGPTTWLASRICKKAPPAAVLLISPITSAIRVVSDTLSYLPLDIFENLKKFDKVTAPTLIFHGTEDEVVPYEHGVRLSKAAPNLYKFVPLDGAGHNDIECDFYEKFVTECRLFCQHLYSTQPKGQWSSAATGNTTAAASSSSSSAPQGGQGSDNLNASSGAGIMSSSQR
eukprot:GFYU01005566.1.p1 GENE.GFYU01005566.1~~GFYU01005566.1.p1  ORF type:complete len:300 (-),score=56.06 GFYU01005566.1:190-1089(-)